MSFRAKREIAPVSRFARNDAHEQLAQPLPSAARSRSSARHPGGKSMSTVLVRSTLLFSALVAGQAQAQTVAPATTRAAAAAVSARGTPAWTLKTKEEIRWQQVTPAGPLLISTDRSLMGIDIERGQMLWEKAELGGLPADSVRMVDGSILMEAARPGLLLIFDPVTGSDVFDSRRLGLAEIVTRRVLPQSGTILIHGRRPSGPPV